MRFFMYEAVATYTDYELTCKTNNVKDLLFWVNENLEAECPSVEVLNALTGEVMMHTVDDSEKLFMSPEYELMWLGWMIQKGR